MTDPMTPKRLDEIDRRLDGITPGLWSADGQGDWTDDWPVVIGQRPGHDYLGGCPDCGVRAGFDQGDATFLAHAPQDIADLRAEVERLRAQAAGFAIQVAAARSLHVPIENAIAKWCDHDKTAWPCPTVEALDPQPRHHEWWVGCEATHPQNGAECVRIPANRPHITAGGYRWDDDPTDSAAEDQA